MKHGAVTSQFIDLAPLLVSHKRIYLGQSATQLTQQAITGQTDEA